jgi:hypothetical protein
MTVDIGALVTSIGGLGATIAGAVPSLKKPKRRNSSAKAAAQASAQVQKAAIGAAGTGAGSSRGLALRSGLRAASQAALESGGAMAAAANADETRFQAQVANRNKAISGIANAGAEGLAQVSQSLIRPQEDDDGLDFESSAVGDPFADDPSEFISSVKGQDPEGLAGADTLPTEQPGEEAPIDAEANQQMVQEGVVDFDPVEEAVATHRGGFTPEIETQLEMKLQMKSLMLQEAERQGITIDSVLAKINRGLGLQPGQTSSNAYGIQLQPDAVETGEE